MVGLASRDDRQRSVDERHSRNPGKPLVKAIRIESFCRLYQELHVSSLPVKVSKFVDEVVSARTGSRNSVVDVAREASARILSSVARPVVTAVVVTEDVHLILARVVSTGRCRPPLGRVDTSPAGRTRVGAELLRFVGCGRGCRVVFAHGGLSLLGLTLVGSLLVQTPTSLWRRPDDPCGCEGVRPGGISMVSRQRHQTSIGVDAILIPLPFWRGLRV